MKKMRLKGMEDQLDYSVVDRCVKTVNGLEAAHINMSTGEITYDSSCVDEDLMRETFAKEGLTLEEIK